MNCKPTYSNYIQRIQPEASYQKKKKQQINLTKLKKKVNNKNHTSPNNIWSSPSNTYKKTQQNGTPA